MKNVKMNRLNKKGFTLVELLLVIAIIGILAAVLFVSLGNQRERARATAFKEAMRATVPAWTTCADAGGTLQSGDTSAGGSLCSAGDFGEYKTIHECTGGATAVSITVVDGDGDDWNVTSQCARSDGDACVADCTMSGCEFYNNDDHSSATACN